MHELLHVQLGPRANHLGTHAWNIAESHFAYSDTDTDYDIDHGVDWREGFGREVSCQTVEKWGGRGRELDTQADR